MLSHTGVGLCLKLGKILFLENHNLIALERLAHYSFFPVNIFGKTRDSLYLYLDYMVFSDGIGLLILAKLTVLSFYLSFSWELLQQLFLDDCYWIWNVLSTTHTQEREVPLLKPQSFNCNLITSFPASVTCCPARFHSLYWSHFNPKGQKLQWSNNQHTKHPRRQIPVKSNNSCGIREIKKGASTKFRLCTGTNQLSTTYLWLESESLRSLLQNFHCLTVGNSARGRKKSLR